jgi:polar amino acid transport system substrate-binding protein
MRRAIVATAAFTALAAPWRPLIAAPPACNRPFSLGLHEHGLLYASRSGEGIDKDIADEMARRSGCRIVQTVLPRARIWQLVESGGMDFSLTAIANPQRERFAAFAWYVSDRYSLLVRRDARVASVADFRRNGALRLGLIRSFRYGPAANAFADALEADQRVSWASSLDPLYELLRDNRIQGMIIEPFDMPRVRDGIPAQAQTRVLEFDDPAVPHGLVMSRAALAPGQIAAWAALVQDMRRDGTIRRIFEKYFPPGLARALTEF